MPSADDESMDEFSLQGESKVLKRTLFESFYCEPRSTELLMHVCMTDYVNANALRSSDSPCFKCAMGEDNRNRFAKEG